MCSLGPSTLLWALDVKRAKKPPLLKEDLFAAAKGKDFLILSIPANYPYPLQ
jgi:hypothetical protein